MLLLLAWGLSPLHSGMALPLLLPASGPLLRNTLQVFHLIAGPRLSRRPGLPSTLPSISMCSRSGPSPLLFGGFFLPPSRFVVVCSSSRTRLSLPWLSPRAGRPPFRYFAAFGTSRRWSWLLDCSSFVGGSLRSSIPPMARPVLSAG